MKKFSVMIVIVGLAAVAISVAIQRRLRDQLRANDRLLQQQEIQLAELDSERQTLTNLLAQSATETAEDPAAELKKLRAEVAALRMQTNAAAKQPLERPLSPSGNPANPETYSEEYYAQRNQMAAGRMKDAEALTYSLGGYAYDHQGKYPSTINPDEIAPYLRRGHMSLTGTNEFEIVYQGSLDELSNIPRQTVVLIRERQPWIAPSGRWARVYGMVANSGPQVIESDDNFQSFESDRIIPPPPAR